MARGVDGREMKERVKSGEGCNGVGGTGVRRDEGEEAAC
jgi:hypothetical protein